MAQASASTLEAHPPSPLLPLLAPIAALLAVAGIVASGADSHTTWYIIRGTGVVAYALLGLSVIVGMMISSRAAPAGEPRVDLYEVHNFTSLLALAFASVHGLALLVDNYIGFSPTQILVPFTASYRPLAVSLGIIGLYISVAIYGSFWARRFIGYKRWRQLHYATFASFALVTLHGMFSGADAHAPWLAGLYASACAAVLGLGIFRVANAHSLQRVSTARSP